MHQGGPKEYQRVLNFIRVAYLIVLQDTVCSNKPKPSSSQGSRLLVGAGGEEEAD